MFPISKQQNKRKRNTEIRICESNKKQMIQLDFVFSGNKRAAPKIRTTVPSEKRSQEREKYEDFERDELEVIFTTHSILFFISILVVE